MPSCTKASLTYNLVLSFKSSNVVPPVKNTALSYRIVNVLKYLWPSSNSLSTAEPKLSSKWLSSIRVMYITLSDIEGLATSVLTDWPTYVLDDTYHVVPEACSTHIPTL